VRAARRYAGVGPQVYAALMAAPSKGEFVNEQIKPNYSVFEGVVSPLSRVCFSICSSRDLTAVCLSGPMCYAHRILKMWYSIPPGKLARKVNVDT
jgi:hypothetical protein